MAPEIRPSEGWGVLHLFYRVDRAQELPPAAAKELERVLVDLEEQPELQTHLFAGLGHKADFWLLMLSPDLTRLRAAQTAIEACDAGAALDLVWSYISLTETSEYTPTVEEERARLEAAGVTGDDLERRLAKARQRLEEYTRHRLYPELPRWPAACFYPMSHRRVGEDNWYRLPFEERRRLMHEHGRSGRAFHGRVLQLVTGSVGLDDWEWGVTLLAHDVADLKRVVYRLRFDEASARYAEFGPFVLGLRRSPAELVGELALGR